jgi:hypothetical protein
MPQRLPCGAALAVILVFGLTPRPAPAQAAKVEHAEVRISFAAKAVSSLPLKGALRLSPEAGRGEPIRLPVTSRADLSLSLPPGSKWEVSAELPGFWVPRKALTVGPPEQPGQLSLDLWPLGTISGQIKAKDRAVPLPKQILVETLAAPPNLKRPGAPKGAMDCPVDKKGAWSCSLPAATFDLVISAQGFIPHYRWGVRVPAGKPLSLGTLELERGNSVAGWIAVEDGSIEPEHCIARLAFLVAGGANLKSVSDLKRAVFQREVSKDGFFQFTGLAPGTYILEVQQPGYPAARLSPVRVESGVETFLREPVMLRRSLALQFEVHPPQDWLGRSWRAEVFKITETPPNPLVFEGLTDEDGRLTVPGQSSGRFRVSLGDSLGNRLYSGEHSIVDLSTIPEPIEVRFVTIDGRVRLGAEPLEATLWFGGRSGATAVKMDADVEGRFHGVLPRAGLWRIEVEAAEPGFPTWARTEVRAGRSGKASLNIDLPDTRIFGRVVDEEGKPVPKSDVLAVGESVDLHDMADANGGFELRGLPEGPLWLGAESGSQISDRAYAMVIEGRTIGPIELRLHPTKQLTGVVASPQGPVAGSRVTVLARTSEGGGAVATTGTDGAFQVNLHQRVSRVGVIVSAPGFALRAFDSSIGGESLSLQVSEEKGNLEVTLPMTGEELARENLILAAFQNGLPVPASILSQWAYDHGQPLGENDGVLRVPDVAPGDYRVCLLPRQLEIVLAWASIPDGASCDSGLLAVGGTLSLKPHRPG